MYCVNWTDPPRPLCQEMRDEGVPIRSRVPRTTLIIIFIDEYHRRQDDEVAICVRRLSRANTARRLCHWKEICSRVPVCFPAGIVHFYDIVSLSAHGSDDAEPEFLLLPVSQTSRPQLLGHLLPGHTEITLIFRFSLFWSWS